MGLRADAATRTSTSPAAGVGVGNSPKRITSGGPGASMKAAFMGSSALLVGPAAVSNLPLQEWQVGNGPHERAGLLLVGQVSNLPLQEWQVGNLPHERAGFPARGRGG